MISSRRFYLLFGRVFGWRLLLAREPRTECPSAAASAIVRLDIKFDVNEPVVQYCRERQWRKMSTAVSYSSPRIGLTSNLNADRVGN